ncbi:MAG: S9 family peptidase [Candidatus Didemnitutus sp.]|nr:S9 family peptidase [Candidatus Didemnitutus sp.]
MPSLLSSPFARIISTTVGALLACALVHAAAAKRYTIEELLATEAVSGASLSPDGSKVLITSDRTGILNAYALPVDGSAAIPLTTSTSESILARSYFPHDERFLYEADQGGNELNHVFVRELDGTARDLTPGARLKASFRGWSDDQQSFFVTTNERDPRYFDLYEISLEGYARTLVYENKDGRDVQAISADKRFLALGKPNTRKDSDVYLLDRQTGEIRELLNPASDAVVTAATFSKDGQSLYYLTDLDHEFQYLIRRDLASNTDELVLKTDWDIVAARLSRSGQYLTVSINRDSRTELRVTDIGTGQPLALPVMPGLKITTVSFAEDESAIAFYVEGGRSPGDLFHWSLGSTTPPVQLTRRLNPVVDPVDLVEPEVVTFTSFDGLTVPGVLYKPHGASPEQKAPALVWVHGGPGGQSRADWSATIQYFVNQGYAVFAINNRGSSGYGKTFYALDDQRHGSDDLDDCVTSKQMLIDTGWVDPDRIAIIGGSYGGYMVCAALTFRTGAFKAGVNIFGVTNWVRTLKSIPAWWEAARNSLYLELGNPDTQEEYLRSISPLFHAKNIKDPLMVLQGANDPRVLQIESDEIVAAARANGAEVDYLVFPDEGHGFRKKVNQIKGYESALQFLNRHLGIPTP